MNYRQATHATDRLSVLAFPWALATISHHMAFPWWFDRHTVLNLALVVNACLVLARPRSVPLFTTLAALGLVNVAKLAPEHPNHMLLGRAALGSWQDDLVDIVDSDLPSFSQARDERMRLPFFRFRRLAGTAGRDFEVRYRRKGELRILSVRDGEPSDLEAATAPSWLARKLLYFREVDAEGPTRCWN